MRDDSAASIRILADIGGTNIRFAAQVAGHPPGDTAVFATGDFPGPQAAINAYLARLGVVGSPRAVALAIACPVAGDRVEMTNNRWSFSIEDLRRRLGVPVLKVVNDFTAVALAVPHLLARDLNPIGDGKAVTGAPVAVIGPGTGLGVSALIPTAGSQWVALETEGGHVTAPAANERESAVLALLRDRFGHASAERCLSGQGLVNLYNALAELGNHDPRPLQPAEVTGNALNQSCSLCVVTVDMFCAMLGTVVGNLALTIGARGGVYIAGGIVPRLGRLFGESLFRHRFEGKGRFSDYMKAIPTFVVTRDTPAFLGLEEILDQSDESM